MLGGMVAMAPERRNDFTVLGCISSHAYQVSIYLVVRALIGGILCCLMRGSIAAILFEKSEDFKIYSSQWENWNSTDDYFIEGNLSPVNIVNSISNRLSGHQCN